MHFSTILFVRTVFCCLKKWIFQASILVLVQAIAVIVEVIFIRDLRVPLYHVLSVEKLDILPLPVLQIWKEGKYRTEFDCERKIYRFSKLKISVTDIERKILMNIKLKISVAGIDWRI